MAERSLISCIASLVIRINLCSRRLLLLSVVRPSIEYGSAVWDCNKDQASALEAIVLGGAKKILGCSSKTCNEAVRGEMGLDTLSSRGDRAKLKWWHNLKEDRYPRQLFDLVWEVRPRRGRQRKMWGKRVDDIFEALLLDKEELLEDIKKGKSLSKSFLACADECVSERESKAFWKGLDIKTKLYICTRVLLSRLNSKGTYMAYVMQRLDFCLSLDQARMV